MDNYAKEEGFDPLVAANWLKVKKCDFVKQKVYQLNFLKKIVYLLFYFKKIQGAASVLYYHNKSLKDAVIELYPEFNITRAHFHGTLFFFFFKYFLNIFINEAYTNYHNTAKDMDDTENQRKFFEELATELKPNIPIPESFYNIRAVDVAKKKVTK